MGETIRITGALSPREADYNKGYEDGKMINKFVNMTNSELAEFLDDYGKARGGEISDLTREAARRIEQLVVMEDDGK